MALPPKPNRVHSQNYLFVHLSHTLHSLNLPFNFLKFINPITYSPRLPCPPLSCLPRKGSEESETSMTVTSSLNSPIPWIFCQTSPTNQLNYLYVPFLFTDYKVLSKILYCWLPVFPSTQLIYHHYQNDLLKHKLGRTSGMAEWGAQQILLPHQNSDVTVHNCKETNKKHFRALEKDQNQTIKNCLQKPIEPWEEQWESMVF